MASCWQWLPADLAYSDLCRPQQKDLWVFHSWQTELCVDCMLLTCSRFVCGNTEDFGTASVMVWSGYPSPTPLSNIRRSGESSGRRCNLRGGDYISACHCLASVHLVLIISQWYASSFL